MSLPLHSACATPKWHLSLAFESLLQHTQFSFHQVRPLNGPFYTPTNPQSRNWEGGQSSAVLRVVDCIAGEFPVIVLDTMPGTPQPRQIPLSLIRACV